MNMTTEQLITTIAEAANCTPADIMGKARLSYITNARHILQAALRRHGWRYTRIAKVFQTDHSTVRRNIKKINKSLEIARVYQATEFCHIDNIDSTK